MNLAEEGYARAIAGPDEKRWLMWRKEDKDGRLTKMPYTTMGQRASSTDPAHWCGFDDALAAVGRFDGMGIVFTGSQLGVDLDHCIKDGVVSEEIAAFIEQAQTYTEVSPSGTGLHLYFNLTAPLTLERNRHGSVECYISGRYFTVTGKPWSTSYPIRTVTPAQALDLLRLLGYPWKKEPAVSPTLLQQGAMPTDDKALLALMFTSSNGERIKGLYEGDLTRHGGDYSTADAALCSYLAFWTGKDADRMERIWLESPLGNRHKTQARGDYRERTIAFAIEKCTEVYKGKEVTSRSSLNSSPTSVAKKSRAVITRLADIQAEPVRWLWPGRIALGKLTLVAGDPGFGKSLLTVDLAARVSRGSMWPDQPTSVPLGDTLFLSVEDDPADTIRPRLDAAGADCSRVHILRSVIDEDTTQRTLSFKRDMEALEDALTSLPECRLVIVDPVSAYLDDVDSHKNADVRGLLAPLADLASRLKIAVVLIQHLNKGNAGTKALYRPMGSLAFIAAARAAYIVVKDKDNPDRRLMLPAKNNIAKDTSGMAYSLVTADNGMPRLVWDAEPVTTPVDEALAGSNVPEERTETDWALLFLRDLLAKGPVDAREAIKQAKQAGVGEKALRRAREQLGIKPTKQGFDGGWVWALPVEGAQGDEDAHDE